MKGVGIHDAFVEDDFVSLGFFDGLQCLGVDIAFDFVRIVDSDFSRIFFGFGDFVDDVSFEQIEVQLFLSACVESEPAHFAFDFSVFGFVPIILRTRGGELDDVISGFEFAGEFSEMISQRWDGLTGSMREDDRIRVEVQHLFGVDSTESFSVEFESGPTRVETGHEDVDIDLNGICLLDVFVDYFDHLVVHYTKGLKFLTVVLEELVQSGWVRDAFHFTLVALLTVLAPETVQHHFGQRTTTGVLLDLVGLEGDTFFGSVIFDVLSTLVFVVAHPVGPTAGFLFDFEKRVDVRGEHVVGIAREVPYFIHVLNDVALVDSFLQFGGWPGAHETALRWSVGATTTSFRQRFGLFLFHAGSAEWEGEFTPTAIG